MIRRQNSFLFTTLLSAARDLYEAGGDRTLTVRRLGKATCTSPALLYRYFRSKAELLDCVGGNAIYSLCEVIRKARDRPPAIKQPLIAMCEESLEFARANPRLFELMFRRAKEYSPGFHILLGHVRIGLERQCLQSGAPASLPDATATAWIAMLIGGVALEQHGAIRSDEAWRMMCTASERLGHFRWRDGLPARELVLG